MADDSPSYIKFRPPYEDRRSKFVVARPKRTFHLLGLSHLPVSSVYQSCAFTQKIHKMARMLMSLGHNVYVYGAEGGDVPCTEYVVTHSLQSIRDMWGDGFDDPIGYDWKTVGFRHDFGTWRPSSPRRSQAKVAVPAIRERKEDDHYLLNPMGNYFETVANEVDLYLYCEPGVAYNSLHAPFCAFESHFIQSYAYGALYPGEVVFGQYYDRVIPNYFDAAQFPLQEKKSDYFFFIGRIIKDKGIETAIKACEYAGAKLVVAGQLEDGYKDFLDSPVVEFVGYVDPEQRADYMGYARAVFVPTVYLEPFGGVNVEAQMCGTPVITTDFGVFPETVIQGVTGYRCSTLKDFCLAVDNLDKLASPRVIHELSQRYSMDSVRFEFQKWFDDLYEVWESSVDPNKKGWHRLP